MQRPLQVISDALTTLQVPENALQAALILAAVALGWWADTRTDRPYVH